MDLRRGRRYRERGRPCQECPTSAPPARSVTPPDGVRDEDRYRPLMRVSTPDVSGTTEG